ncbi:MAG: hypothetical protein IJ390_13590 [Lachnospiraceae bacterium]|nr:hypothetical protein [Lachnospiraceae bacterium]
MKMKRILAMLLTGVMAAGCLAGCAQSAEETAKAPESTAAEVSETAEESSEAVQETAAAEEAKEKLVINEPVTLSVFTYRQNGETNDAN